MNRFVFTFARRQRRGEDCRAVRSRRSFSENGSFGEGGPVRLYYDSTASYDSAGQLNHCARSAVESVDCRAVIPRLRDGHFLVCHDPAASYDSAGRGIHESIRLRLHSSKRGRLEPFLHWPNSRSSRPNIPAQFRTGSTHVKMETVEDQDIRSALRFEPCYRPRAIPEIGFRQSVCQKTTLKLCTIPRHAPGLQFRRSGVNLQSLAQQG